MFTLWIYEAGRAQLVTSARHLHTLRLMWRPHRDALIAQDGVVVDRKPTLDPAALRAITRALAAEPAASAPEPAEVSPEPGDDAAEVERAEAPAEPISHPAPTAPSPCAARGCAGQVPPGDARPELADLCAGHRSMARKAAQRLGVTELDTARAIRTHGAATRGTVHLSRAAEALAASRDFLRGTGLSIGPEILRALTADHGLTLDDVTEPPPVPPTAPPEPAP